MCRITLTVFEWNVSRQLWWLDLGSPVGLQAGNRVKTVEGTSWREIGRTKSSPFFCWTVKTDLAGLCRKTPSETSAFVMFAWTAFCKSKLWNRGTVYTQLNSVLTIEPENCAGIFFFYNFTLRFLNSALLLKSVYCRHQSVQIIGWIHCSFFAVASDNFCQDCFK